MASATMSAPTGSNNMPTIPREQFPWNEWSIAVFINGIGGEEKRCKQQAEHISSYLFGTTLAEESKVKLVFNEATKPTEVHPETFSKVLKLLTEDPMIDGDGEDLRLLIICHSNGTKVVKRALEDNAIEEKLKGDGNHYLKGTCEKIKRRVVVVAFGGVTIIPETAAKCVLNYVAVDDYASRACINTDKADCRVLYVNDVKILDDGEITNYPYQDTPPVIRSLTESTEKIKSAMLFSSQSSSSKITPHYLSEYLEKKPVRLHIKKTLSLPDEKATD